jgi:hypothetical protein
LHPLHLFQTPIHLRVSKLKSYKPGKNMNHAIRSNHACETEPPPTRFLTSNKPFGRFSSHHHYLPQSAALRPVLHILNIPNPSCLQTFTRLPTVTCMKRKSLLRMQASRVRVGFGTSENFNLHLQSRPIPH